MRSCGLLLIVFLLMASIACQSFPSVALCDTDRIRNGDIDWQGTWIGLVPEIVGDASRRAMELPREDALPMLFEALQHDDQFIAAHVLLTHMFTPNYPRSAAEWNNLRVILTADGQTIIDPGEKDVLITQWCYWLDHGQPPYGFSSTWTREPWPSGASRPVFP